MFHVLPFWLLLLTAGHGASGTVDMYGVSWAVVDAIAFPCEELTCVAMMSTSYDRAKFHEDGRIDSLDLYEHTPLDRRQLVLEVDADGRLIRVIHEAAGNWVSSAEDDLLASYVPRSSALADGIAGAVHYGGDPGSIQIEFDLPIDRGEAGE